MALNTQAMWQNIKASLEKYIGDNLVTTEGFKVDYEGLPFEVSDDEWVQERIMGPGGRMYHRQVSSTETGQTTEILLSMNVFVKKENTTKSNRHYEIRDVIADYFKDGTEIDMYDFSTDDFTNSLQKLKVREKMTDQPIPNDSHYQWNLTVIVDWLEKW